MSNRTANMTSKPHILLVEDEASIADTLLYALATESMKTTWKSLTQDAEHVLAQAPVDLIILDVGLPDANGFEWCKKIRQSSKSYRNIPVLFLTARKEEIDRIIGFEIGGDDYVTKPFSPREVTARVKAILKRSSTHAAEASVSVARGAFLIDSEKLQIHYYQQPLQLTRYEYRILSLLLKHPQRVFSRAELMNNVWEEPDKSFDRAVDTHIKSIRAKLQAIAESEQTIKTHRGMGYSILV